MSIKLKKKKNSTNTKRSGLVLTMILFSPLQWHFYFFWILPLPSPSGICGQSHLELPELLAKSFCREGELAAFSWTVEGRRNANYNCKLYFGKPKKKKNRWLLFGPQFWKGQRKTSLLRKRQRVYLGCLLRKDYQLLEAVTIVKHFFFFKKPTQLKFFGDLTLYHSSNFTVAEASKFQDLHSPPASRTQPGAEGSTLPPTPTAGFRTRKSRPRDPLRRMGWIIEIRSRKADLKGWQKRALPALTLVSPGVSGK